jgi:hypothetical protein
VLLFVRIQHHFIINLSTSFALIIWKAGISAFAMDWSEDDNFVYPAVKKIVFVVHHILAKPCAILVFPFLPSGRIWHFMTSSDEKTFLNIFKRSHIFIFSALICI